MDLLGEIRKLKAKRQNKSLFSPDTVQNPLPNLEESVSEASKVVQTYCSGKGITLAEFIEECRLLDQAAVDEYHELRDLLDCDILGKWRDGILTDGDITAFQALVVRWKDVVHNIITLHANRAKNSAKQ
jgi:hypothetical protein